MFPTGTRSFSKNSFIFYPQCAKRDRTSRTAPDLHNSASSALEELKEFHLIHILRWCSKVPPYIVISA
jgi:hypothetical protein